jgi:hypothetical protein
MKQEMSSPDRRPDINLAQVAASALAAVSAAVVASFLGVGGTVLGAALGSTVATVAGAVYAHTFRQARDRLTETRVLAVVTRARTAQGEPGPGDVPVIERDRTTDGTAPAYAESGSLLTAEGELLDVADPRRPRWMSWKTALLVAVAAFVLALVAISVIELTIGRPISGGSGTTVTQLVHHRTTSHRPAPAPTPQPTSSVPAPTTSPTPTPTGTPTQTPVGTPTSVPTSVPTSPAPTTAAPSAAVPTG